MFHVSSYLACVFKSYLVRYIQQDAICLFIYLFNKLSSKSVYFFNLIKNLIIKLIFLPFS